jgi:erythromycin esterase
MRYRLAVLILVSLALFAQTADERLSATRAELSRSYSYLESALQEKRFDDALSVVLPEATIIQGNVTIPFRVMVDQMKKTLEAGAIIKQNTTITSVTLAGSEAKVSRRSEGTVTIAGRNRTGIDLSEDTWVYTPDGWRLKSSRILGSKEVVPATTAAMAKDVASDLNDYARPLDDLAPLADAIGDARIVALGEATHGTHEFFTTKARIIEYLAETKGFTVLAVEGNWPEVLAIDRYIKTGTGDPKDALARLNTWPLFTKEMLDLIESMRAYNLKASTKLTFTGFDMQSFSGALARVVTFIEHTSPGQLAAVNASYQQVRELGPRRSYSDPHAKGAAEAAREVVGLFDKARDAMVAASTYDQWRDAKQAADIVFQATAARIEGQSLSYRDEMMAQNADWLLTEAHSTEKMIVWAHNGHIALNPGEQGKSMGALLRQRFGENFYSVGFALAGGEVRAVGSDGLSIYHMPPAPEGTGDEVLALARLPSFFLDIRRLPEDSFLWKWLIEPHRFYTIGARWNDALPDSNISVFSPSRSFDGLVFFREGRASTQIQ